MTLDELDKVSKYVMKIVNKHYSQEKLEISRLRKVIEKSILDSDHLKYTVGYLDGKVSEINNSLTKVVHDHALGVQRVYNEMQELKAEMTEMRRVFESHILKEAYSMFGIKLDK